MAQKIRVQCLLVPPGQGLSILIRTMPVHKITSGKAARRSLQELIAQRHHICEASPLVVCFCAVQRFVTAVLKVYGNVEVKVGLGSPEIWKIQTKGSQLSAHRPSHQDMCDQKILSFPRVAAVCQGVGCHQD